MLSGYEERRAAFSEEGVAIIAASVDPEDKTAELASDKGFVFGHSMSREDGLQLGAWYQEERKFIQPAEFILSDSGKVMYSSYADGPVGRMDPQETLVFARYLREMREKSS